MSEIGLKTPGVQHAVEFAGHVGERLVAELQFRHRVLRAGCRRRSARRESHGQRHRRAPERRTLRHPGCLRGGVHRRRRCWAWAPSAASRRRSRTAVMRARKRCTRPCRTPWQGREEPGARGTAEHLPDQRAAAGCQRRSRQGQAAGREALGCVRHAADLHGLHLRERLQPLRPHLPGRGAGRRRRSARTPRTSAR